jgi:hypothetical protein
VLVVTPQERFQHEGTKTYEGNSWRAFGALTFSPFFVFLRAFVLKSFLHQARGSAPQSRTHSLVFFSRFRVKAAA